MTPVYLWAPGRRGTQRAQILQYCKCSVTISFITVWDTSGHCSYTSLIVKCQFSRMMRFTFCFNASVMTEGRPDLSASWTSVRPFLNIVHHFWTLAAFMFATDCNKSLVNFTGSNVFCQQKPNHASHLTVGRSLSQSVTLTTRKSSLHQLHQVTIYTLLNTPNDWSGTMKQLCRLYAQTFFTFQTALVVTTLLDSQSAVSLLAGEKFSLLHNARDKTTW